MEFVVPTRLRCASSAAMFVLTLRDMLFLLEERRVIPQPASCGLAAGSHAFRGGSPSHRGHRPGSRRLYSLGRGFLGERRALGEDVDVEALVLPVLALVALVVLLRVAAKAAALALLVALRPLD